MTAETNKPRTARQWLAERSTLERLCERGLSAKQIAQMYGETVPSTAQALNSLGLKTRHMRLREQFEALANEVRS